MSNSVQQQVVELMQRHRVLTLATVRPDGYPQATIVTYANDGLTLYFGCDKQAQKVKNLRREPRVSAAIGESCEDWSKISALSLGGRAEVLRHGSAEAARALALLRDKFPQWAALSAAELAGTALVRVRPEVISLLDYSQGFGHTELLKV